MAEPQIKRSIRVTDDVSSEEALRIRRQLDRHIGHFDAHVEQQNTQWNRNMEAHANTTQALDRLIIISENQQKAIAGPAEAYQATKSFGKFVKWIGAILVVIVAGLAWVKDHIIQWVSA